MDDKTSIAQKVIGFLWRGEPEEARAVILSEQARLNSEITALREQLAVVGSLLPPEGAENESRATTPPPMVITASAGPPPPTPDEVDARRRKVIDTAMEIVKVKGGQITVAEVAEALRRAGYDLGVQPTRANTAVAGILFRSGPFRRVVRGVFEYVGPELFSTEEDARKENAPSALTDEASMQ